MPDRAPSALVSVSQAAHLWLRGHTRFHTTLAALLMLGSLAPIRVRAQPSRDDAAHFSPTRSVEIATTVGGGVSDRAGGAIEVALDFFVPRYWLGVRGQAGSHYRSCFLVCGAGYTESFGLIAIGATRQLSLHRDMVTATLFVGPSIGSLHLGWDNGSGIFGGCDDDECTPAPTAKPRIGSYLVVGVLASAALSFHAAAFMVGAACDLSLLPVDGVAYVSATIGPRVGASF